MTLKLGLTGSIGMGKTTTAQMFAELGVPVWDADAVVHRLYARGGAAVGEIGKAFPSAIVGQEVSREVLKDLIVNDADVLVVVEGIVHPLVANDRAEFLKEHTAAAVVLFDIPLLFETGADSWLDHVICVSVPADIQASRVMARAGMNEAQFAGILARQMPDAEKRARADTVISTLNMGDTQQSVQELLKQLTKGHSDA